MSILELTQRYILWNFVVWCRGIVRPGGRVTRLRNVVDCKSRTQFAKLKFVVSGRREREREQERVGGGSCTPQGRCGVLLKLQQLMLLCHVRGELLGRILWIQNVPRFNSIGENVKIKAGTHWRVIKPRAPLQTRPGVIFIRLLQQVLIKQSRPTRAPFTLSSSSSADYSQRRF